MKRSLQGVCIVLGWLVATAAVLAVALAWGPHQCKPAFIMVIGCVLGNYESLAGGMIAAGTALFAGWLAWSGVQVQIAAEVERAATDRVEVENALQRDLNDLAEGLASIWKILANYREGDDPDVNRRKLGGVTYGIDLIAKGSWLSTSRRMVTELGWERRRKYEALFDGLDRLRQFRDINTFDVDEALSAVKDVSVDFEILRPDCAKYFEGFFRRLPKAWTLGYTIEAQAGVADNIERRRARQEDEAKSTRLHGEPRVTGPRRARHGPSIRPPRKA